MSILDPDAIQSYYSQLSNEELTKMAKKEGHRFSEEAINYLYGEIVRRGLDMSILENLLHTKDLNVAVAALDPVVIDFAIQEKKAGKSDSEILQRLTDNEINEAQATLIISRLPEYDYENVEFDKLIAYRSPMYWFEMIKTHPENIVWIKPMIDGRGDSFFPFYKERSYQLHTKDRKELTMILGKDERQIFFEGVKYLLPHAHIGYTYETADLYSRDPERFINTLLGEQLYRPIDTFESLTEIENAPHFTITRHDHD